MLVAFQMRALVGGVRVAVAPAQPTEPFISFVEVLRREEVRAIAPLEVSGELRGFQVIVAHKICPTWAPTCHGVHGSVGRQTTHLSQTSQLIITMFDTYPTYLPYACTYRFADLLYADPPYQIWGPGISECTHSFLN